MSTPQNSRLAVAIALSLLVALATPAARAASPADAANPVGKAAQHFRRGVELFDQQAYAAAVVEFQQAYQIEPHSSVLYNLSQAYVALDRPVEAVGALESYLGDPATQLTPARREQLQEQLRGQRRRVGTVRLELRPVDAAVTVDGQRLPAGSRARLHLSVGLHLLTASRQGFQPTERSVTVIGGEQQDLPITLVPLAAPPGASVPHVALGPPERPKPAGDMALSDRSRLPGWAYTLGVSGVALLGASAGLYLWNHERYGDWKTEDDRLRAGRVGEAGSLTTQLETHNQSWRDIQRSDRIALGLVLTGAVALAVPIYRLLAR